MKKIIRSADHNKALLTSTLIQTGGLVVFAFIVMKNGSTDAKTYFSELFFLEAGLGLVFSSALIILAKIRVLPFIFFIAVNLIATSVHFFLIYWRYAYKIDWISINSGVAKLTATEQITQSNIFHIFPYCLAVIIAVLKSKAK